MKSEIIQHKGMKELGKRTSGCGRIQEKGAVKSQGLYAGISRGREHE